MRWISLDAGWCSVSKIPVVEQGQSFRIGRIASSEVDREGSWTVIDIRGSNRDWRLVAAIGNLAYARVKVDVVEGSIERIFRNAHNPSDGCRKISHADRVVVDVKCEIFDPLVSM